VTNTWRKLKQLICDGRERAQHEGWRQAGRWLAKTVISLPYSRIEYTVFARSLLEPLPVAEPRRPVTFRLATETDLQRFRGLFSPSRLHHFKGRLAHGRYCFIALDDEHLAAYCWATTQIDFDVDNLEMSLQAGDAYVDDAYTVPTYRRQGIQTAVHLYRLQYMRRLGCQRAVLIVEDENIASQRLVRKLGYQEVDCLSFRRVLWKRTYHYHSGKH
jgi:RimJ/RimL family protein N-acetyltransferase